MPAKSKAQQKMFGIAHAIQQGKMPASKARGPATDVAKAAKPKDVKDFASTKTKNLPQKVKKESKDATLSFGDKPTSREKWPVKKWNTKSRSTKTEQVERIREYVTKVVREVLAEAKSDEVTISQGQDGDWWVNGPGGYQDGPFKDRGKAWGAMVYYKKRGITSQGVGLKEASGTKSFNVGQVVYYNGEDGTVVSVSSKSGRIVKVAFDYDHVSFARSNKDGKYRAQGSSLNSTPLSTKKEAVNEAKGKKQYLAWYDKKKGKWFEKVFTKERDANRELDIVGDRLRAAGDKHPNISYGTDNSIYG